MEQEFKISNRDFYKIYFEGSSPLTSVQMWFVSSLTFESRHQVFCKFRNKK